MGKEDFNKKLSDIDEGIAKQMIQKQKMLEKALHSDNIDSIYKAQSYLRGLQSAGARNTNAVNNNEFKSLLLDPHSVSSGGYVDKKFQISFDVLRNMGKVPLVKAIVETRKEQVMEFLVPQKDKYSPGFIIRPKKAVKTDAGYKFTKQQEAKIEELTNFLLNCGDDANRWHGDDLQKFGRKLIHDSLVLDQGTAEIIRTRKGDITEFLATDGATYRVADTFNPQNITQQDLTKIKDDTLPFYIQLYQHTVHAEYYPWELMFCVRNPQSDIFSNGYGRSELEDLIETVTSILNADAYNSNYFKVGSNPKGILKVSGDINQGRLEELKTGWQSQVAGVKNAHKMLIMEADKMDFVSTQQSNKDMEFSHYQEFLIKVLCAIYKIDPSEINFPMGGASDAKPMFEGNNEARLKHSRDKGLKPLLKAFEAWFNKYLIRPKSNNEYELVFEGLDAETPEQELDNDIKAVQNWSTVNEIRAKRGMKPIEGGDIILNPIMMQAKQMEMQQQQMAQQGNPESNQNVDNEGEDGNEDESNPFMKALETDLKKILTAA